MFTNYGYIFQTYLQTIDGQLIRLDEANHKTQLKWLSLLVVLAGRLVDLFSGPLRLRFLIFLAVVEAVAYTFELEHSLRIAELCKD